MGREAPCCKAFIWVLGLLCGLPRPTVMTGYLLTTTYPGLQELALDLPRYSEEPLLGTASSVLIISDLSLKRLYSIFGSEKLQRKLVSDIQSLLAILGSDSSCLLQHAHDGVSSLVERVVVT